MRCGKRAQAAMEFLMTYGWALLVVLIAIGALAFFGVLNPSRFLPETCTLGPGFACADFRVNAPDATFPNGLVFINVQNGLGVSLDIFHISIAKEDPSSATSSELCGGYAGIVAVPGGAGDVSAFLDGEERSLFHSANPLGPTPIPGINCDPAFLPSLNCCGTLSTALALSGEGETCDPSTSCVFSPPVGEAGSKFSENLIVAYREVGSQIIHTRVGRLSAQVEAS